MLNGLAKFPFPIFPNIIPNRLDRYTEMAPPTLDQTGASVFPSRVSSDSAYAKGRSFDFSNDAKNKCM